MDFAKAAFVMEYTQQITGLMIDTLPAALHDSRGLDLDQAAANPALIEEWAQVEPEARAGLLLSVAWGSRDLEVDLSGQESADQAVRQGALYAKDLHEYAQASPDSETFHGVSYPMMPLPGQAGALASSLGFDREDLHISLRAALVLFAPVRAQTYPTTGIPFPGRPGYLVGDCGHAVAGSEWRAGFRVCEHCPRGTKVMSSEG